MRQGRIWNVRGGLAALANGSTGELTLGQLAVPTAMLCYTSRSGTQDFVFCVWEETLSALCGQPAQSWVFRCLALRLGAALCCIPRVVQVRCLWADGRMTSVEHAGMVQMPRYHTRWLGWAGAWVFLRKSSSRHQGRGTGQVLTKNGPGPRTVTAPGGLVSSAARDCYMVQVPAGFLLHIVPLQSQSQS